MWTRRAFHRDSLYDSQSAKLEGLSVVYTKFCEAFLHYYTISSTGSRE